MLVEEITCPYCVEYTTPDVSFHKNKFTCICTECKRKLDVVKTSSKTACLMCGDKLQQGVMLQDDDYESSEYVILPYCHTCKDTMFSSSLKYKKSQKIKLFKYDNQESPRENAKIFVKAGWRVNAGFTGYYSDDGDYKHSLSSLVVTSPLGGRVTWCEDSDLRDNSMTDVLKYITDDLSSVRYEQLESFFDIASDFS